MREKFCFKCQSSELPAFRERLRTLLKDCGWDEKQIGEWILVLDEALTNVIRHAYAGCPGAFTVEFLDKPDSSEFLIEDQGQRFDPTQIPSPQLPKETPGGLGVHLIRSLTDKFEYDPSYSEGNRIRLVKWKTRDQSKRSLK